MDDQAAAVEKELEAFRNAGASGKRMNNPRVEIATSMGIIKAELFPDAAPVTVKNFLSYVDDKFYEGTVFHRVVAGAVIQGGGYERGMQQKKTKSPIKNEAGNGIGNARGTLAMARTGDPHSATAQFFINVADNEKNFDHRGTDPNKFGYAVFGRVVEGMDVVDKINRVKTGVVKGQAEVPSRDVVINSIRIFK